MIVYGIGLIVSASIVVALLFLFSYEERRGARYGERIRGVGDVLVTTIGAYISRAYRGVGSNSIRQALHYVVHTILRLILAFNAYWDKRLRTMMHVNKMYARDAERERTVRSKLEELALHKSKYALTEEEKRQHKDNVLNGF